MAAIACSRAVCSSLSARRAWIEIQGAGVGCFGGAVALRKESVDRNPWRQGCPPNQSVALRKESVDRNASRAKCTGRRRRVALRKESVDRNFVDVTCAADRVLSLSARRAWIEIQWVWMPLALPVVALRKESVDRNLKDSAPALLPAGRSPQGERG